MSDEDRQTHVRKRNTAPTTTITTKTTTTTAKSQPNTFTILQRIDSPVKKKILAQLKLNEMLKTFDFNEQVFILLDSRYVILLLLLLYICCVAISTNSCLDIMKWYSFIPFYALFSQMCHCYAKWWFKWLFFLLHFTAHLLIFATLALAHSISQWFAYFALVLASTTQIILYKYKYKYKKNNE